MFQQIAPITAKWMALESPPSTIPDPRMRRAFDDGIKLPFLQTEDAEDKGWHRQKKAEDGNQPKDAEIIRHQRLRILVRNNPARLVSLLRQRRHVLRGLPRLRGLCRRHIPRRGRWRPWGRRRRWWWGRRGGKDHRNRGPFLRPDRANLRGCRDRPSRQKRRQFLQCAGSDDIAPVRAIIVVHGAPALGYLRARRWSTPTAIPWRPASLSRAVDHVTNPSRRLLFHDKARGSARQIAQHQFESSRFEFFLRKPPELRRKRLLCNRTPPAMPYRLRQDDRKERRQRPLTDRSRTRARGSLRLCPSTFSKRSESLEGGSG